METDLSSTVLLGLFLYFMRIASTFLDIKYIYNPFAHLVVSACFAELAFCEYLQCVRAPQRMCTVPTFLLITDPSVACMFSDCEGASQPFS